MSNNYERALTGARETLVRTPEFEAIAAGSERDREAWTDESRDKQARARRWLLVAAAVWLSWPVIAGFLIPMPWGRILWDYVWVLPSALVLLWGARLSREGRLRSAILTHAIAASNLTFAFVCSLTGFDSSTVFAVLLAVSSGRSLQLLGERGLDGSEDPESRFEPVKFRGILILALIMAGADALTLLWGALNGGTSVVWSYFFGGYDRMLMYLPEIGLTAAAAVVMAINVWGLLRLRTWALLSNMAANVVIAALAWGELLATGPYLGMALVVNAGIQLLLPLPILAAALGVGKELRYERVGGVLLGLVVPGAVLGTIVATAIHWGSHR